MSFQMAAFYASLPTGLPPYTDLPPVSDPSISVNPQSGRLWSSRSIQIFGSFLACKWVVAGRVYSQYQPPNEVFPLNADILPLSPARMALDLANPIPVGPQEDVIVQASHSDSGTQDAVALVWYSHGRLVAAPPGPVVTIFGGVSGATSVPFQWTTMPFQSWALDLPPGPWAVVGASAWSSSGIAFRFVFPGSSERPGGLQVTDRGALPADFNRLSPAVEWGRFTAPVFPRVEVLTNAAVSSVIMWVRVVRL